MKGQAKLESIDGSTVLEVDANKYVEFPVEKTEQVFTVLAEFGDQGSGLSSNGASQQLVVLEETLGVRDEITTFDDSDPVRYWSSANRRGSTQVASVGVTMTVTGQSGYNLTVDVDNPAS